MLGSRQSTYWALECILRRTATCWSGSIVVERASARKRSILRWHRTREPSDKQPLSVPFAPAWHQRSEEILECFLQSLSLAIMLSLSQPSTAWRSFFCVFYTPGSLKRQDPLLRALPFLSAARYSWHCRIFICWTASAESFAVGSTDTPRSSQVT